MFRVRCSAKVQLQEEAEERLRRTHSFRSQVLEMLREAMVENPRVVRRQKGLSHGYWVFYREGWVGVDRVALAGWNNSEL